MDIETEELVQEQSVVDTSLDTNLDDQIIFSEAQLAESLCETHSEAQLSSGSLEPLEVETVAPGLDDEATNVIILESMEHHSDQDPQILETIIEEPEPPEEPLPTNAAVEIEIEQPIQTEEEPPCSCPSCQAEADDTGGFDPTKARCLICYAQILSPLNVSVNVNESESESQNSKNIEDGVKSEVNATDAELVEQENLRKLESDGTLNEHSTVEGLGNSDLKTEPTRSEDFDFLSHKIVADTEEDPQVRLSLILQILKCSMNEIGQDVGLLEVVPLCDPCHSVVTDAVVIFNEIQRLEKTLGNLRETIKDQVVKSFETNFCKKKKESEKIIGLMGQIDATRRVILGGNQSLAAAKNLSTLTGGKKRPGRKKKTIVSKAALYPQVTLERLEPANGGRRKRKRGKVQTKDNFDGTGVKQEFSDPEEHYGQVYDDDFADNDDDEDEVIQTHSGRLVKKPNYKKWLLADDDEDDEEEEIQPEVDPLEISSPKSEPEWSPGHTDEELGDDDFDSDDSSVDSDVDLDSDEDIEAEKRGLDEFGALVDQGEEYIDPVTGEKVIRTRKKKTKASRIKCPECPRTFADEIKKEVHMKRKHQPGGEDSQVYNCDKCSKHFKRPGLLRKHLEKQHGEEPEGGNQSGDGGDKKRHMCDVCGQKYRNASELRIHVRQHTGETPYKCEHCDKSFVSSLKREFHIEQCHWEVPPLKCEFCTKAFFRQHRLRIHRISHTGEKAYLCEICSQSFSHPTYLKYHQGQHAELNMETFKCKDCGKQFANPTNLRLHVKTVHLKEFRFTCEACGMGFTHMSHKRIHMRGHTGERPYKCDLCGEAFRYKDRLRIHMRGHTGERPFICDICKKGFASRSKLKRHEKIHERNQPNRPQSMEEIEQTMRHRCDDCGKGFAEPQHLSAHRRYCQRKVLGEKEERPKSNKSNSISKARAASTAVVQKIEIEHIPIHQSLQPQQTQMLVPVPVTYTYPVTYGYEVTQTYHQQPSSGVREYPNYN